MATTVVGLFDDKDEAQRAVQDLMQSGFNRNQVSVVAADPQGKMYKQHADEDGNLAGEGAASGLTSGAVVGGLLGLLIGAGLLFVPAGVVAAGPITGLIAGGAAGAATGGILGGLIGMGIPEEHADVYAESVRRGGSLVMVQADGAEVERAKSILDRDGAIDIEERAAAYRSEGYTKFNPNAEVYNDEQAHAERARYRANPTAATAMTTTTESTTPVTPVAPITTNTTPPATTTPPVTANNLNENERLEVIREDLAVGKREVERGGVRVRSYMTERPVTEQVTLREEHVNIDRRPVDRPVDPSQISAFKEGTIEVREHAEVPVVAKEARVVEEIAIGKTSEQRTETVSDVVHETHVDVERIGGTTTNTFDDDYYRGHFQSNLGTSGGTYDSYRPAYQFGHTMASDQRFAGRDFASAENDIRTHYETQNPGQYSGHRNAIQAAYDRARTAVAGVTGGQPYADRPAGATPTGVPNSSPGIQTGGLNNDGSADTRGITEKLSDAVTGDRVDDKTGKRI